MLTSRREEGGGRREEGGGRRESHLSKQGKRSMTRNMVTDHPKPNVAISGSHVSACDHRLWGLEDLGGEIWMGFGFDLGLLVQDPAKVNAAG
jgi:hypothetical protein